MSGQIAVRVSISWSGERSRALAEALEEWIPTVIQGVEVSGRRRDDEGVARAAIRLVCITPENLNDPSLAFEAGALSGSEIRIVPYVFELRGIPDHHPLSGSSVLRADQEGTGDLLRILNAAADQPLEEGFLATLFRRSWPDLEDRLRNLGPRPEVGSQLSDIELTDQALALVQQLAGRPQALRAVMERIAQALAPETASRSRDRQRTAHTLTAKLQRTRGRTPETRRVAEDTVRSPGKTVEISDEQLRRILRMHREGGGYDRISEATGFSRWTVAKNLKDAVAELHRRGADHDEIAAETGFAPGHVAKILRSMGVSSNRPSPS